MRDPRQHMNAVRVYIPMLGEWHLVEERIVRQGFMLMWLPPKMPKVKWTDPQANETAMQGVRLITLWFELQDGGTLMAVAYKDEETRHEGPTPDE